MRIKFWYRNHNDRHSKMSLKFCAICLDKKSKRNLKWKFKASQLMIVYFWDAFSTKRRKNRFLHKYYIVSPYEVRIEVEQRAWERDETKLNTFKVAYKRIIPKRSKWNSNNTNDTLVVHKAMFFAVLLLVLLLLLLLIESHWVRTNTRSLRTFTLNHLCKVCFVVDLLSSLYMYAMDARVCVPKWASVRVYEYGNGCESTFMPNTNE